MTVPEGRKQTVIKYLAIFFCIWISSPLIAGARLRFAAGSIDPLVESLEQGPSFEELVNPTKPMHYIVQLHQTPRQAVLKELSNYAKFLNYFPDHAYIVKATPVQANTLRIHPAVRWVGLYVASYKYRPEVVAQDLSGTGPSIVRIDLFSDANLKQTRIDIESIGARVLKMFSQPSTRWRIEIPPGRLADLAQIADVQWIENEGKRELRNSTTSWVIQSNVNSNTSVWNHVIHGEGQVVGHIDGLIDGTSCYLDQLGKFVAVHNQSGGAITLHGTNTAGTFVGDKAPYGTADNGDGNAFAAQITHRNLEDLNSEITLYGALQVNHGDGARVHSNSWGDDTTNTYTQDCRDIDQFSSETEDDLVIFSISNLAAIKSPENAKNVLAVGASQQASSQANHCMGGSGPTLDGRTKPEIFAPGCNISTANISSCGLTTVSGTSLAAPAVGGAATLVRQYFTSGFYPTGSANGCDAFTPTGTLIKAALLNSAVDMTGVSGYPNNVEGWGRVLLENALYFAGDSRKMILRDIRHSAGFPTGATNSNDYSFSLNSGDSLRVTLVWADVESPVAAQGALINDLDLEVTTPNGIFKGNVFSGGQSSTGGNFDNVNNVEQVAITNPGNGNLIIRVIASDIPSGPQGYALVVSGNVSECSNPPAAPSNLTVTPGPNQLMLSWTAVSGASYEIERNNATCSDPFTCVGTSTQNSFVDLSVSQGVSYNYVVRSVVGGCISAPSSCQSGTPGAAALFTDNFDDGNANGWTFLGKGNAGVVSNELELSVVKKETAVPTFSGCDNCIVSADVEVIGFRGALQFSYRDKANFREVRLEQDKDKVVVLEKRNGDRINKEVFLQTLNSGQTYHVEIQAFGSSVIVSIDGLVLLNSQWGDVPSGGFRLLCKDATCQFDNVLVEQ